MTPDGLELEALGQVDPPDPAVLDAAREYLWAAVAAEMLSAGETTASPQTAKREAEGPRQAENRPSADPGA